MLDYTGYSTFSICASSEFDVSIGVFTCPFAVVFPRVVSRPSVHGADQTYHASH